MAHRHPQRLAYPDCWDLVGGHIEPGEAPEDAVRRECREEIRVDICDPQPIPMTIRNPAIEMHAFVVTAWVGEPANRAPGEHDDLRWYHPDEIAGLTLADPASREDIIRAVTSHKGTDRGRRER